MKLVSYYKSYSYFQGYAYTHLPLSPVKISLVKGAETADALLLKHYFWTLRHLQRRSDKNCDDK